MGNSVSGPCAIIFMNFIEEQILSSVPHITLWKRFIDDCFVVFKDISSHELLDKCNDIHPDVQFTFEEPVGNVLPFLDLSVERANSEFKYALHSKPCHSGNVIHWTSHHPRSLLVNIAKNELRRAIRNSSSKCEENKSVTIIMRRFRGNGYPQRILINALRCVKRKTNRQQSVNTERKKNYLVLPFLSERQVFNIKRALFRTGLNDFLTVSFKSNSLSSILKPKHFNCVYNKCAFCSSSSGRLCLTKHCVYFIQCNLCSSFYIGETKRTMRTRLSEHVNSNSSLVFQHLAQHGSLPHISLISWKILHRAIMNTDLRRQIECREIRDRQPDINVQHAC